MYSFLPKDGLLKCDNQGEEQNQGSYFKAHVVSPSLVIHLHSNMSYEKNT